MKREEKRREEKRIVVKREEKRREGSGNITKKELKKITRLTELWTIIVI